MKRSTLNCAQDDCLAGLPLAGGALTFGAVTNDLGPDPTADIAFTTAWQLCGCC